MANSKRKELIEKYRGYKNVIGFVSENNLINEQPVDMGVAFDMIKANAEAAPENRLYNMPADWTEEDYAEFLKDCEGLE